MEVEDYYLTNHCIVQLRSMVERARLVILRRMNDAWVKESPQRIKL